MADVTRERAQLILVSGLLIAVTMLVLVLLLNTAIYTENVATRGIDSDVSPAADVQNTLDREVASILGAQNETQDSTDAVDDTVGTDLTALFDHETDIALERGHILTIENRTRYGGIFDQSVEDDTTGDITDIGYIRTFEVTLNTSELSNESVDIISGDWSLSAEVDEDDVIMNGSPDGSCIISNTSSEVTVDIAEDCSNELLDEDGIPQNVSPAFSITVKGNESVGYELITVGEELDADGALDGEWYADGVAIDLKYESSEIRYSTTRSVTTEAVP